MLCNTAPPQKEFILETRYNYISTGQDRATNLYFRLEMRPSEQLFTQAKDDHAL